MVQLMNFPGRYISYLSGYLSPAYHKYCQDLSDFVRLWIVRSGHPEIFPERIAWNILSLAPG